MRKLAFALLLFLASCAEPRQKEIPMTGREYFEYLAERWWQLYELRQPIPEKLEQDMERMAEMPDSIVGKKVVYYTRIENTNFYVSDTLYVENSH